MEDSKIFQFGVVLAVFALFYGFIWFFSLIA